MLTHLFALLIASLPAPQTAWQPGNNSNSLTFLGWSSDSRFFAVHGDYVTNEGEGGRYMSVRLRSVRDAWTTRAVGLFRAGRPAGDRRFGRLGRGFAAASPEKDWAPSTAKLGLPSKPPGSALPSGWTLRVTPRSSAKAALVAVKPATGGVDIATRKKYRGKDLRPTRMDVVASGPDHTSRTLTSFMFPLNYGCEVYNPKGSVRAYPSPDGKRVVLVIATDHGQHEECGDGAQARLHVRALGPLVRIRHAGPPSAARSLAAKLEAAGYPVSDITQVKAKRVKGARIAFRQARDEKVARAIAKALKLPHPVVALDEPERHWAEVTIDLAATP